MLNFSCRHLIFHSQDPLLNTFNVGAEQNSFPTSVDFIRNEGPSAGQMVVGLGSAAAVIYDLGTGQPVTALESRYMRNLIGA